MTCVCTLSPLKCKEQLESPVIINFLARKLNEPSCFFIFSMFDNFNWFTNLIIGDKTLILFRYYSIRFPYKYYNISSLHDAYTYIRIGILYARVFLIVCIYCIRHTSLVPLSISCTSVVPFNISLTFFLYQCCTF